MAEERAVDEQLVAVLNDVLDAVYQAKQALWSATTSPARDVLRELVSFLIETSGRFMEAEERIGGRSPEVSSPSSHQRGNLVAEANGDHAQAVSLLADRLTALAVDARDRARVIPDTQEAEMLDELANGLEVRIGELQSRTADRRV